MTPRPTYRYSDFEEVSKHTGDIFLAPFTMVVSSSIYGATLSNEWTQRPPPRVSAGHRTSRERLYQSDIREPWAGGDSRATRDKAAALGARALGR